MSDPHPPVMLRGVLVLALALAAAPCGAAVCLDSTADERAATLRIANRSAAPAGVRVTLTLENATSSAGDALELTLAPHEAKILARITGKGGRWSWHYDFRYALGDPAAAFDRAVVYALPFAPGTPHKLLQGENGTYTHQGDDAFAYDFEMPEGTIVLAAREGVVVDVKNDQTEHGETAAFDDKANFISVLHPDGTLGLYVHLQPGGARVKVGDPVVRGQFLGLSGNTGHSQGPHLHFEVNHRADLLRRQTVPVKFRTGAGPAVSLQQGEAYAAP